MNWKKLTLELLVVFLGVTSGFLLNNWRINENKAELEQMYLKGFYSDIEDIIGELEVFVDSDSVFLERAMPMIYSIIGDTLHTDSAFAALTMIINVSKLSKNTGTWNDISNSGNLNLLNNFQLRQEIVDYYMEIDGLTFLEEYFYQYFSDYVMPFVIEEYSILKVESVNPDILTSVKFYNVFAGYVSMIQQRNTAYKKILDRSYALKENLNLNIIN